MGTVPPGIVSINIGEINVKCGVKFCGGCNPRYERGKALDYIKEHFHGQIEFVPAQEGVLYDLLLIIGGCTNCCASYQQYMYKQNFVKMWNESHIDKIIEKIEQIIK